MKNKFLEGLTTVSSYKETENGAFALSSTGNDLLNAFGTLGAMRSRNEGDVIDIFMKAYAEDKLLAMKMLFYIRDLHGGVGERDTFRIIVNHLAKTHKDDIEINLEYIPEFGRWDDLYAFVGTDLEDAAFELMHKQYLKDLESLKEGKSVSLIGKWLKSAGTSSITSRKLGKLTAQHFNESLKDYRKHLTALRKAIDVVEVKMTDNEWTKISYEKVPSYAAKNYAEAFRRHDENRYTKFLESVEKGETTIKASTLFPYDILRSYGCSSYKSDVNATLEAQWKALPNYITEGKKFLVMADTSGSMSSCMGGLPLQTSVSLAIYFAERNEGEFGGRFLTFTDTPRLVVIPDEWTLREKINFVLKSDYVGYNTDLEKAFKLVLDSAIKTKCPKKDMPEAILVISDMEIDEFGSSDENTTFTSEMKKRFEDAGYKMPTLVYWNVSARMNTFHAEASEDVRFVSGSSAAIFKGLCEHMGYSAKELMLNVLNDKRYECIKVR